MCKLRAHSSQRRSSMSVTYFPVRRRRGETPVRCSCRRVRARSCRDRSAASGQEVRRCRWRCTGSERGARCASPTHQTEPPAPDTRTLRTLVVESVIRRTAIENHWLMLCLTSSLPRVVVVLAAVVCPSVVRHTPVLYQNA